MFWRFAGCSAAIRMFLHEKSACWSALRFAQQGNLPRTFAPSWGRWQHWPLLKWVPAVWILFVPPDFVRTHWGSFWDGHLSIEIVLAMNQTKANIPVLVHSAKQRVLYRSIKQNHKIAKTPLSYHPDIQHFRVKTFLCRPDSLFFCYRLKKQNKIETHGV